MFLWKRPIKISISLSISPHLSLSLSCIHKRGTVTTQISLFVCVMWCIFVVSFLSRVFFCSVNFVMVMVVRFYIFGVWVHVYLCQSHLCHHCVCVCVCVCVCAERQRARILVRNRRHKLATSGLNRRKQGLSNTALILQNLRQLQYTTPTNRQTNHWR